jgi:hypothetical protein
VLAARNLRSSGYGIGFGPEVYLYKTVRAEREITARAVICQRS